MAIDESSLRGPVPLEAHHETASFDCGVAALNGYLQRFAMPNQQANAARTYVAMRGDRIVGYYTLAFGSIEPNQASTRVRRGLAKHPIAIMLLARLAVDVTEQKQGIGRGLLKDAILRTLKAAEIAGLRAIVVHAKDGLARKFYESVGFEPSPIDEFHLMLLLKDAKSVLAGS